MLVISYNPGYPSLTKNLKPSTRQRFVAIDLDFPPPGLETQIVAHESGVDHEAARRLVQLGGLIRHLRDSGLDESPSTRVLTYAGLLIRSGIARRRASELAIAAPLSDDPALPTAVVDRAATVFTE
jgi:nitric oxide reductase NorQ protein